MIITAKVIDSRFYVTTGKTCSSEGRKLVG